MSKKHLALYGLKWNPFAPDVPVEALHVTPRIESFSTVSRAAFPCSRSLVLADIRMRPRRRTKSGSSLTRLDLSA